MRIVDSGIGQADALLVATVVARLEPVAGIQALLSASVDPDAESTTGEAGPEGQPDQDALSAVQASAGNVSLATIAEMSKLQIVRQVDLPRDVFAGIAANVVAAWRARAAVESPSHLARHDQPVRLVLLAALLHLREREISASSSTHGFGRTSSIVAYCSLVSARPSSIRCAIVGSIPIGWSLGSPSPSIPTSPTSN